MHLKQDRTQQIRKENMRFKSYGKYGNETNFVEGFYWYLKEIHLFLFCLSPESFSSGRDIMKECHT